MTHPDSKVSYAGCLEILTSFLLVSTGSVILTPTATGTSVRGEGLLPGGSVTWTSTGVLLITLGSGHNYRYVTYMDATLQDTAGTGKYATLGTIANEGGTTPITVVLQTFTAGGTPTDFVGVRCFICIDVKNSMAGS